jgi:pimeloyl-ACP methyl ester carboxylesterase
MNTEKKLLILHGAIGSSSQLHAIGDLLKESFDVHLLDFSGHGGKEIPAEEFSIKLFCNDVLKWLKDHNISRVNIFGYSMGGYVALYLARHYPQLVKRIFTLATKFHWTPESAQKEVKMLDPLKILEKVPAFAQSLLERHAPSDWKTVLLKTSEMMLSMGTNPPLTTEDFRQIENKVLLCVGDRDKMVTIEETINVYRQLKNASLLVLPETGHGVEEVKPGALVNFLSRFST